jgi:hypothetical protein
VVLIVVDECTTLSWVYILHAHSQGGQQTLAAREKCVVEWSPCVLPSCKYTFFSSPFLLLI